MFRSLFSRRVETVETSVSPSAESLFLDLGARTAASRTIRLHGEPIAQPPERVIDTYRRKPLDAFLASEARHGIGNYVLVDRNREHCRIVTSPGYCGGYLHAGRGLVGTTAASVLAALGDDVRIDPFGFCYLLGYAPKSAYNQLPFCTPFEDLLRLPPASVAEFRRGERTAFYSYIRHGRRLDPPATFEAAMKEVAAALAAHFRANRVSPALMFSGGADCLAIYLALRDRMGGAPIRAITVSHGRANGPDRAFAVADNLGMEIEHIEDAYSTSVEAHRILEGMMRREIVSGRGPNMALLEKPDLGGTIVVHGQNMDAITHVNMLVLQANLDRPYLSRPKVSEAKTDAEKLLQYESFLGNLPFTAPYLEDRRFQKQSAAFFAKLCKGTIPDPSPGREGIWRGMISSQVPNLLYKPDHPLDQVRFLDREVARFRSFVGEPEPTAEVGLQLIRYLTYAALANKRMATLSLPDGSRHLLVAQSGPMLSYYIGRTRSLSDAASPKRETYAFVKTMTGRSYNDLAKPTREPFALRQLDKRAGDLLLAGNMHRLRPDRSLVIPRIGDEAARAHAEAVYRQVESTARPDDPDVTLFSQSRARHLVNLELLVETAREAGAVRRAAE